VSGAADAGLNATQKVCAVLRALGSRSPAALRDLAAETDMNKVTAFRILGTLVSEGFVRRPAGSRLYELGPEVAALAASLAQKTDLRSAARPPLLLLAAESGDTAVLSLRVGANAVCIERQTGDFPIQSNYLYPGTRRPLGIGAGATAILAALPEAEANALLDLLPPKLEPFPRLQPDAIREAVRQARQRGYAVVLDQIVDKMGGIAVALRAPDRDVVGSFSILALTERIPTREQMLVALLQNAARAAERSMAELWATSGFTSGQSIRGHEIRRVRDSR